MLKLTWQNSTFALENANKQSKNTYTFFTGLGSNITEHILWPDSAHNQIPSTLYSVDEYCPNFQSPRYWQSKRQTFFKSKNLCISSWGNFLTLPNSKYIRSFIEVHRARCLLFPVIRKLWKEDGNPAPKCVMSKTSPTQARPRWRRACSVEKTSMVPSYFIPQLENPLGSKKKSSPCYLFYPLNEEHFT